MIVIDVGCATYGEDSSIEFLLSEFQPTSLFGFDPNAANVVYTTDGGTVVVTRKEAAWIFDGTVDFVKDGTRSKVSAGGYPVVCFDLSTLILDLDRDDIVLKMDAETAEYTLLPYLVQTRADERLKLAWIEWHCLTCGKGGDHREGCVDTESADRRATIEAVMRCEMRSWHR